MSNILKQLMKHQCQGRMFPMNKILDAAQKTILIGKNKALKDFRQKGLGVPLPTIAITGSAFPSTQNIYNGPQERWVRHASRNPAAHAPVPEPKPVGTLPAAQLC